MRPLLMLFASLLLANQADAQEHTLTIASQIPEGSPSMTLFHGWASQLEQHTRGQVKVEFLPAGVAGDDRDVVRKIRLATVSGATVSGGGLSLISGDLLIVETPLMIADDKELDYVRTQLDAELRKKFEQRGYVLLLWTDVGPVHLFSRPPIMSKANLSRTKLWMPIDDPIGRAWAKQVDPTNAMGLGVPDVLPSLQTELITAFFAPPTQVNSLHWSSKVKFMLSTPIGYSIGATIVAKKDFDRIPGDLQEVVLADSRALETSLRKQVRDDNARALRVMQAAGIQVIEAPDELVAKLDADATLMRTALEGSVYTREFRERIEGVIVEYRARRSRRAGSSEEPPPVPRAQVESLPVSPPTATPTTPAVPSIEDLMNQATDSYAHEDYAAARASAQRAIALGATASKIWRIIGASSCFLKDKEGARKAWNRIEASDRQFLNYVCVVRNGIDLQ